MTPQDQRRRSALMETIGSMVREADKLNGGSAWVGIRVTSDHHCEISAGSFELDGKSRKTVRKIPCEDLFESDPDISLVDIMRELSAAHNAISDRLPKEGGR